MQEKKLKTLLCMILSVNKKFLFFCLQFSFNNEHDQGLVT